MVSSTIRIPKDLGNTCTLRQNEKAPILLEKPNQELNSKPNPSFNTFLLQSSSPCQRSILLHIQVTPVLAQDVSWIN
jgi:hypothetical protein